MAADTNIQTNGERTKKDESVSLNVGNVQRDIQK